MNHEVSATAALDVKEPEAGLKRAPSGGLTVERFFTTPGVDPADELAWGLRTASSSGEYGKSVFEQKNIEVPKSWSMLATDVVASKYFRGTPGTCKREMRVLKLLGQNCKWRERRLWRCVAGTLGFSMDVKAVPLPKSENYAPLIDLMRDVLGLVRGPTLEPVNILGGCLLLGTIVGAVFLGVHFLRRNRQGLGTADTNEKESRRKPRSGSSQSGAAGKKAKKPRSDSNQSSITGKKAKTPRKKSPSNSGKSGATGKKAKTPRKKSPSNSGKSGPTGNKR